MMTRRALLVLLATLVCGCTATPIHLPITPDQGIMPPGRRDLSWGAEAGASPDASSWKQVEAGGKKDGGTSGDGAKADVSGPPTDARGEGAASDGSPSEGKPGDARAAEGKVTLD